MSIFGSAGCRPVGGPCPQLEPAPEVLVLVPFCAHRHQDVDCHIRGATEILEAYAEIRNWLQSRPRSRDSVDNSRSFYALLLDLVFDDV